MRGRIKARSVRRWRFNAIDDEDLRGRDRGVQLETELFLDHRERRSIQEKAKLRRKVSGRRVHDPDPDEARNCR